MNLWIQPEFIKKEMTIETLTTELQPIAYSSTDSLYKIKLTYKDGDISVYGEGYNEIKLMKDLIIELNDLYMAFKFNSNIPKENVLVHNENLEKIIKNPEKTKK